MMQKTVPVGVNRKRWSPSPRTSLHYVICSSPSCGMFSQHKQSREECVLPFLSDAGLCLGQRVYAVLSLLKCRVSYLRYPLETLQECFLEALCVRVCGGADRQHQAQIRTLFLGKAHRKRSCEYLNLWWSSLSAAVRFRAQQTLAVCIYPAPLYSKALGKPTAQTLRYFYNQASDSHPTLLLSWCSRLQFVLVLKILKES